MIGYSDFHIQLGSYPRQSMLFSQNHGTGNIHVPKSHAETVGSTKQFCDYNIEFFTPIYLSVCCYFAD